MSKERTKRWRMQRKKYPYLYKDLLYLELFYIERILLGPRSNLQSSLSGAYRYARRRQWD